jgi:hypothetical protein
VELVARLEAASERRFIQAGTVLEAAAVPPDRVALVRLAARRRLQAAAAAVQTVVRQRLGLIIADRTAALAALAQAAAAAVRVEHPARQQAARAQQAAAVVADTETAPLRKVLAVLAALIRVWVLPMVLAVAGAAADQVAVQPMAETVEITAAAGALVRLVLQAEPARPASSL